MTVRPDGTLSTEEGAAAGNVEGERQGARRSWVRRGPRQAGRDGNERSSRARDFLAEFAARVGAPRKVAVEAAALAEAATGGDWGRGRWVELLSAASTYAAARRLRMPLSLPECAAAAQAPPHQIGAACVRLTRHLSLSLPPTNIPAFLQRAVHNWHGEKGAAEAMASRTASARALVDPASDPEAESRRVLGDAVVLWEFGRLRGLDAGRNPLALGAAALLLAASVARRGPFRGGLALDDVCELMHASPWTVKGRRAEIVRELAEVAAGFPLGVTRVTIRTVVSPRVLPLVLTLLRGLLPPTPRSELPLEQALPPPAKRRRSMGNSGAGQGGESQAEQGGAGTGARAGGAVSVPGQAGWAVPGGLPPSFKSSAAEVERVASAARRVNARLARWGLPGLNTTPTAKACAPTEPSTVDAENIEPPPAGERDLHLERLLLSGCSPEDLLAGEDLAELATQCREGTDTLTDLELDREVEAYLRSDMQAALYHEVELLGGLSVPVAAADGQA